jgi:condensin complex subunit 3
VLAIFFETMMKDKKQQYLQQALLPTLYAFMDAGHESPLANVKLESVLKFVINSTRSVFLHTCIAKSFLEAILDNPENKDILKILSKELLTLDVADADAETNSQLTYLTEEVLKVGFCSVFFIFYNFILNKLFFS